MKAILVDDERHCRDVLDKLLSRHCPEVTIVAKCANGQEALEQIQLHHPDVLFLDVEMPGMNGFELLERIKGEKMAIIFTTAYNEYAVKAIRHNALDYLVKPVDKIELKDAVLRAKTNLKPVPDTDMHHLMDLIRQQGKVKRLTVSTLEGVSLIDQANVVYCESDDAYCRIHLVDGRTLMVSRPLKDIEQSLDPVDFCRIHHRYVIRMSAIDKYIRGDGGEVVLNTGLHLPVSRTRKQEFLRVLEKG